MTETTEKIAYDALDHAFKEAVARFREMTTHRLVARVIDICAFVEVDPDRTELGDALEKAAQHGSIEAAAAMFAIGTPENRIMGAMLELIQRSPDLENGVVREALIAMADEMFEAEVTAGRMIRFAGPDGKPRYKSRSRR